MSIIHMVKFLKIDSKISTEKIKQSIKESKDSMDDPKLSLLDEAASDVK